METLTLSESIKGLMTSLVIETEDNIKDYMNEKITKETKKVQIGSSVDIAALRAKRLINTTITEVVEELRKERVNYAVINRITDLINGKL